MNNASEPRPPSPQAPRPLNILITAGPTREPIDEVRFISNRSSGRMGIALAEAAAEAGHDVTLLLGPVLVPTTLAERIELVRFQTTAELQALLHEHFRGCDRLIMAAAVADYRVAHFTAGKTERKKHLKIELEGTPDLVAGVAKDKTETQRVIAFALEEPHELETRAVAKMKRKGVDAIVANPLVTMEDDGIAGVYLTHDGQRDEPGPMSKEDFARWLIEKIA
ncbi:MAG: phosphopantothenoylcysteine decarboxylase [Planctomycetota bacterium]